MSFLRVEKDGVITRLYLARTDVRNAFNAEMIAELTTTLDMLADDAELRVLVLAADGPTFCAGADVNWMRSQIGVSESENLEDAKKLFDLFRTMYEFPKPTIARVQGGAFGGGAGLICGADIVVMAENAQTAFSEVRLGIVPATISAFVLRKLGEGRARELFLTGRRISAQECLRLGIANEVVPEAMLDKAVEGWGRELLFSASTAQTLTKELLREVPRFSIDDAREFTAARIARQRVSPEGQEGLSALLEKRSPAWSPGK
ncbi:MAG: enoyl-CoA hydratase/isomerase family protein [Calditrichaeota bacterium]|nr:enoyl-CoA hydratase/isomerase family protein [Calditrichota bacterium]MCB9391512.1 enoyl-CoA hydratase/isomerase family protein [Calditrichota bacterium]